MKNILFELSFCGKNYHGWQVQKNAVTVQEIFEKALRSVIVEKTDIKGCSRTDSAVHANMYCLNTIISKDIDNTRLMFAVNNFLPNDIVIKSCKEVPINFHARYNCIGKEYIYKIWNDKIRNPFLDGFAFHYRYPLDIDVLKEAAEAYVGTHDFTSFCTKDKREAKNMIRTIKYFDINKHGSLVEMKVSADGFLYNMVRIMVGTLLRIAQGKFEKDSIPDIIKSKDRNNSGPTAVPHGLYLNKVFYPREFTVGSELE